MTTKRFALGLLIGFLLAFACVGALRDRWSEHFGPRLLEALTCEIVEEFNRNRVWHGQAQITTNQVLQSIKDRLSSIPDYDWTEK